MYLVDRRGDGKRGPIELTQILTGLVQDLEVVTPDILHKVELCLISVFGDDVARDIIIDVSKRGEIIVKTQRSMIPLIRMRMVQLERSLSEAGVEGEIRIVGGFKAPDLP